MSPIWFQESLAVFQRGLLRNRHLNYVMPASHFHARGFIPLSCNDYCLVDFLMTASKQWFIHFSLVINHKLIRQLLWHWWLILKCGIKSKFLHGNIHLNSREISSVRGSFLWWINSYISRNGRDTVKTLKLFKAQKLAITMETKGCLPGISSFLRFII